MHNYFIPWHREYGGQHNRYDIREAHDGKVKCNTNLLLTERESRTREYWPEVVAVRTKCREVSTKTTEGQYSPVQLELARLVSSLLYGTRAMLVLNLPAFENKKYTADGRFHGNGPYDGIVTNKEPIRTLGFTSPYNNVEYFMALLYSEWLFSLWHGANKYIHILRMAKY